jgi:hypothetical protein
MRDKYGRFRPGHPKLGGNKKGSKHKPKGEHPYRCPLTGCFKPIGNPRWEPKPMTKEQAFRWIKQRVKMKRCEGQRRIGYRRFEKGAKSDPAWNGAGRRIGKRDSYPRVPHRCPHCKRRIVRGWARVLVMRWKRGRYQ